MSHRNQARPPLSRNRPRRSDVDLRDREITIRGKDGKARIVRIGYDAARSLDRYLRIRSRHAQRGGRSCGSG